MRRINIDKSSKGLGGAFVQRRDTEKRVSSFSYANKQIVSGRWLHAVEGN